MCCRSSGVHNNNNNKKIRKQVCYGSLVVFVLEISSCYNFSHIPLRDNWSHKDISVMTKNTQTVYDSFGIRCQQELKEERSESVRGQTSHSASETLAVLDGPTFAFWIEFCERRLFLCRFSSTKTQRLALPSHQYLLLWGQPGSSEVALKNLSTKRVAPFVPFPLLARLQINSYSKGPITMKQALLIQDDTGNCIFFLCFQSF